MRVATQARGSNGGIQRPPRLWSYRGEISCADHDNRHLAFTGSSVSDWMLMIRRSINMKRVLASTAGGNPMHRFWMNVKDIQGSKSARHYLHNKGEVCLPLPVVIHRSIKTNSWFALARTQQQLRAAIRWTCRQKWGHGPTLSSADTDTLYQTVRSQERRLTLRWGILIIRKGQVLW